MAAVDSSSKTLSFEEELELELETFDLDTSDDENGVKKQGTHCQDFLADTIAVTTNSLLRATICELERALKDTRRLLFQRDKDNSTLRQDLEKARKDLYKEQTQRKKLNEEAEKLKEYQKIKQENEQLRSEVEELREKLKSNERTKDISEEDPDEIIPCCSSMNELVEVKRKLHDIEKQFNEFKENNQLGEDLSITTLRTSANGAAPRAQKQAQKELQTQLRIKFLRDAFFYYMIDFYPDEQMKAILAILDYDDRRQDIIIESHKMKRQGKRFTVTEVSSRSLTFVQENR